jgi:hypothetical protein
MLLVRKTEKTKNIHQMLERGRNLIPVSKGNRGNKKVPHPYLRPRREADAGQVD